MESELKSACTPRSDRESATNTEVLIYVVDDESMIGEIAEITLKLKGFRTKLFSDPELALQSLENSAEKPSLMIADFLMRPINGIELIEQCKEIQPNLKKILFSGNVGKEILQYYSVKPEAFVAKPFFPNSLVTTVNSVLEASV